MRRIRPKALRCHGPAWATGRARATETAPLPKIPNEGNGQKRAEPGKGTTQLGGLRNAKRAREHWAKFTKADACQKLKCMESKDLKVQHLRQSERIRMSRRTGIMAAAIHGVAMVWPFCIPRKVLPTLSVSKPSSASAATQGIDLCLGKSP